jgi:hypothetical protein
MNDAQRHIYNMMIDSVEKGSKMMFIMPRKAGQQTLKEAICKTFGHDIEADSWHEGEKLSSLYCLRCKKWFPRYKS